ncbi:hypothetical protein BWI97_14330 [Siphonobacter sp. BAB-5405]|uniref:hypothetical protein n=2 Tax=unclassified Siphonobacter TaxID=2635712 RepID=UPI000C8061DA|nr:hypothetical protein [Siphonobacter sp. BAB-5405]PMD95529.1 hypothetical protein BWI97_14330 [Siphonobacter sp. BAB-5405]
MEMADNENIPANPEETPVIPAETADQKDAEKPPKTLILNNFPPELYHRLKPTFDAWNSKKVPKLPFGHYIIHLLADEEGTSVTIAKLRERIEVIVQENEQLEGRITELQTTVSEKQERIDELENELSEESSAKEHHHLRIVGLESQIKSLQAQPAPAPVARVVPGQYSEKAMLAGMQAVMDKAAELTSPGIFNRFQTFTREQYQAVFQEAYAKALLP